MERSGVDPAPAGTITATVVHPTLGRTDVGLRHRSPAGTPRLRVLLLGGTGQTPETWEATEEALLDAGCELAVTAGRGVVPSAAPPLPWTMDDLVDDALAVLDHLGWTEPVSVIGYSLGGFTAELLARRHPERVGHAVLVAGHHRVSVVARAAYHTALELSGDPAATEAFSRFVALATTLAPGELGQNPALAQTWWELLGLHPRRWSAPHAAEGQTRAGAAWVLGTTPRPEPDLTRVRFTLVCFADDLLVPAGAPARVAAAELGGCPVVEIPGGHGGVLTHPLEAARALVDVLSPVRD